MKKLFQNDDGADFQSQAVKAFLLDYGMMEGFFEGGTRPVPYIARWENLREQGYVIYMSDRHFNKQLNIAFFEHRNSDEICAVKWEQKTINSPTIDTADFGDVYKDKHDVSFFVKMGEAFEMSKWIFKELSKFWNENQTKGGVE